MFEELTTAELIYESSETGVEVRKGFLGSTPVVIKSQRSIGLQEANFAINEALIMSSLNHPHIVRVYKCLLEKRSEVLHTVIVMEQMQRDLMVEIQNREREKRPWEEEELLRLVADLVSALLAAQRKGVAHRDIKPQNVFITENSVKIGDFGSAKKVIQDYVAYTLMGSPFFLSPELKKKLVASNAERDSSPYDPYKSDVYSLGVTVSFMALLRTPLELMAAQDLEISTGKMINSLSSYPRLQPLLQKMLLVNHQARISFQELEESLREISTVRTQTPAGETPRAYESGKTPRGNTFHITPEDPPTPTSPAQLSIHTQCAGCVADCGPGAVKLECVHTFHSKQCFFTFLREKSEKFTIGVIYRCPKCELEIPQQYIYFVFGEVEFDTMVAEEYASRCSVCHINPIYISFDKCHHHCCSRCVATFFNKSLCPLCSKLAKLVRGKTT